MSFHGTPPAFRPSPSDLGSSAIPWLLGAILVFAPIFRSGRPALAVLVLELLSIFLLALILWQPRRNPIRRTQAAALALLFVFPLLYLIPLPAGLVEWLPGRAPYLAGQGLLAGSETRGLGRLSLYPLETESALLLLILPVAVFFGTRMLDPARTLQLVLLLLALAAVQALLGLLQYGASEGSPQLFGMKLSEIQGATGTYTNRNHLAGLLEMMLPISLALMVYSVGRRRPAERAGWTGKLTFFASGQGHVAIVYGAIALLLLLGVIFTRSRAGIALSILAVLFSTMAFSRRIGGSNVHGPTGTVVAIAAGIGIAIGLVPVLDRFSAAGSIRDARWSIFSATLDGIGAFSPLGSGPGTYSHVFPAFQPLELGRWLISHAHNDYLEWLFEGGLIAAVLIMLLLLLYAHQWTRVWTREEWSRFRFVQVGAGIGILLLLLHSLVDFNLHIPANIAYFAFLAGLFFSEPEAGADSVRRKRRHTPRLGETDPESAVRMGEQSPASGRVRKDEGESVTSPDNGDDQQRAGVAAEAKGSTEVREGLARIRNHLAELDRRIPKLLLLQLDGLSEDERTASEIRALEHRLTAYARLIELSLATWEKDGPRPEQASSQLSGDGEPKPEEIRQTGLGRVSDEIRAAEADLESLIGSLDAFVARPVGSDGFTELDARLRDAEQRLQAIAGESVAALARVSQGSPLHHQRAREYRPPVSAWEPGSTESDDHGISEGEWRDTGLGEPRPPRMLDMGKDLGLADFDGRVRRLETRLKVVAFLLLIAIGLIVASWWRPGPFVAGTGGDHTLPEEHREPADPLPDAALPARPIAIQQLDRRVESLESRVAELSLRMPAAPSLHDAPALESEIDAATTRIEEPASSEASVGGQKDSGARDNAYAPQDEKEPEPNESADKQMAASPPMPVDVKTLQAPRFGIQLVAFKDEANMAEFIGKNDLGADAAYTSFVSGDYRLYVVIKGFYQTREEALQAADALPSELKSLEPWVKRYPAGTAYHPIDSK